MMKDMTDIQPPTITRFGDVAPPVVSLFAPRYQSSAEPAPTESSNAPYAVRITCYPTVPTGRDNLLFPVAYLGLSWLVRRVLGRTRRVLGTMAWWQELGEPRDGVVAG